LKFLFNLDYSESSRAASKIERGFTRSNGLFTDQGNMVKVPFGKLRVRSLPVAETVEANFTNDFEQILYLKPLSLLRALVAMDYSG